MNINEAALVSLVTALGNRALEVEELQMLQAALGRLKLSVSEDVVCDLLKAMKDGRLIEAIKAYRVLTGADLRTSKEAVERYLIARKEPTIEDGYPGVPSEILKKLK